MIRRAEDKDMIRLIEMGRNFIGMTGYRRHIPANDVQMEMLAHHLMGDESAALFVACDGDDPIAMLGCMIFVHPVSGEVIASEVFWWVEPEYRGVGVDLLREFNHWAKEHKATKIQMGSPAGTRVGKFYERIGFIEVETLYQREVK